MARRTARAKIDELAARMTTTSAGPSAAGAAIDEPPHPAFETLRAELEALAAEMEDRGADVLGEVEAAIRERPLVAAACALGIGLVLGLAMGRR